MTDGPDPLPFPAPPAPTSRRAVSADMEAIFAEAVPGSAAPAAGSKVRAVTGRRGRAPYATLGVVVAAGLAGLTGGGLLVHGRTAQTAPRQAPAVQTASAQPARMAPVEVAAAPTVTMPTASTGPIPVLDSAPVTAPAAKHAGVRKAKLTPSRRSRPSDLMAADRRLRAAYSHAIRAGVPRHVLVEYRDRWADLREDASWKPERVAAGYGRMSADLERLARQPHSRRAAPPPRHSLFGLFS